VGIDVRLAELRRVVAFDFLERGNGASWGVASSTAEDKQRAVVTSGQSFSTGTHLSLIFLGIETV
jgi:hypothetical protein